MNAIIRKRAQVIRVLNSIEDKKNFLEYVRSIDEKVLDDNIRKIISDKIMKRFVREYSYKEPRANLSPEEQLRHENEMKNILELIAYVDYDYAKKYFENCSSRKMVSILTNPRLCEVLTNIKYSRKEDEIKRISDSKEEGCTNLYKELKTNLIIRAMRDKTYGVLENFDVKDYEEWLEECKDAVLSSFDIENEVMMKFLYRKHNEEFCERFKSILEKTFVSERLQKIYDLFSEFTVDDVKGHTDVMRNAEILKKLSRGDLQVFIIDDEMPNELKGILFFSKGTSIINVSNKEVDEFVRESRYGKYIEMLLAYKNAARVKESEEFTLSDYSLNLFDELEVKNLVEILSNESFAQRYKWLKEVREFLCDEGPDSYRTFYRDVLEDEETNIHVYFQIVEELKKEFYESINVEYEMDSPNTYMIDPIKYGIEIEEVGVSDESIATVEGFDSGYDGSLYGWDWENDEQTEEPTGEYTSPILDITDKEDLEKIRRQVDILNLLGAKTNGSCGFHIHVSSKNMKTLERDYSVLRENPHWKASDIKRYQRNANIKIAKKEIIKKMSIFEKIKNAFVKSGEVENIIEETAENIVTSKVATGFTLYDLNTEFYDMQDIFQEKFKLFQNRYEKSGYAAALESRVVPDVDSKYNIVNFSSLPKHGTVEFRLFNLPDALDIKVIDAYVDFITSYYAYISEPRGNNTKEFVEDAISECEVKLTEEEKKELMFKVLLDELLLKDETISIIENMDKIFEFYNVVEMDDEDSDSKQKVKRKKINYYKKYNKTIEDEIETESNGENVEDEIYSDLDEIDGVLGEREL